MPVKTAPSERRRFVRAAQPQGFGVSFLKPTTSAVIDSVNVSGGGLCLRLSEPLEIHSRVRLQLLLDRTAGRGERPALQCNGRVAWVMQRLDLRNAPPFLFDVGIEFVSPPAAVRQWLMLESPKAAQARGAARPRILEPFTVKGHIFVPELSRNQSQSRQEPAWHLVVSVEGVPCFSGHYASDHAALEALAKFHRQQTRAR
jgi:hypothetical protein